MTDTTASFPSRRAALKAAASGFGYLAFAGLSTWAAERERPTAAAGPLAPKPPHFPARAKRVIFLFMKGGPSHVDTFDYKPRLTTDDGQAVRRRAGRGGQAARLALEVQPARRERALGQRAVPRRRQARRRPVRDQQHADRPAEPPAGVPAAAHRQRSSSSGRALGAWTLYGLGTENQDLPGFVTISPPANLGGPVNYGSAFLPAVYQGTRIGSANRPVADATIANVTNPRSGPAAQRLQLDFLQSLNRRALERETRQPGGRGGDRVVRAGLPHAGRRCRS